MSIIKQGKRRIKPYVQVARTTIEDKMLTWEARGLLCYLLSKPEDWTVRLSDLEKKGPTGKYVIRRVVQELIEQRYMTRELSRGDKGKLSGWDYTVYEDRQPEKKKDETSPSVVSPKAESTESGYHPQAVLSAFGETAPSNKEFNSNKEKEEITPLPPKGDVCGKDSSGSNRNFYDEFQAYWNATPLTPIAKLTPGRKQKLDTRWKEPFFAENWKRAVDYMAGTPFYCGDNDRKWKAHFDFLTRSEDQVVIICERADQAGFTPPPPKPEDYMTEGEIEVCRQNDDKESDGQTNLTYPENYHKWKAALAAHKTKHSAK